MTDSTNDGHADWLIMFQNYGLRTVLIIVILVAIFNFSYYIKILRYKGDDVHIDNIEEIKCLTTNFEPQDILGDYHVLGSHNSCSSGQLDNFYVSTTTLKRIIDTGVRFLDFEIFSVRGKTVVSCSGKDTNDSICRRGSFNEIDIQTVLQIVYERAFASSLQNNSDPIFIQLRIKSGQKRVYEDLARAIQRQCKERILEPQYAYNGENFNGDIENQPMVRFKERIIVVVHDPLDIIKSTPLYEYTNILLPNIALFRMNTILSKDSSVLKRYSIRYKTQFSVILPSLEGINNYSFITPIKIGFHALCLNFQNKDENFKRTIGTIFTTSNGAQYAFRKRNSENIATRTKLKSRPKLDPALKEPTTGNINIGGANYMYDSLNGSKFTDASNEESLNVENDI